MFPRLMCKFWNSRLRLVYICIWLVLLSICLNRFRNHLEKSRKADLRKNDENGGTFDEDTDYVLETLQYMHDFKLGKAKIRPVVEKEKRVREYWWRCHLKIPSTVIINGWLQNDDLSVYSATYDRRRSSLYPFNHAVQVLVMSFRSLPPEQKIFCNLFDMDRERYVVVEGAVREIWQRAWDPRDFFYIPNLISCPVPEYFEYSSNLTVALSKTACKSQDLAAQVRRSTIRKEKQGIAVCVKGMDYLEDIPERLVEWIEMQLMTGADVITAYTYHVPPKMRQVLDHYVNKKVLTVVPITLPNESPNQMYIRSLFIRRNRQQKRRHELIPYNDCLYRHIDTHKYVLILDIDEVIIPLKHDNWSKMLDHVIASSHLKNSSNSKVVEITSVSVRNVFKFPSNNSMNPDIPYYPYMLRNGRKSETISEPGEYGKAFISTNTVSTVFNHFALHRQHSDVAKTVYASPDVALKLHYKEKCPVESGKQCEQLEHVTVEDGTMDKYAAQLTERVTRVLRILSIID